MKAFTSATLVAFAISLGHVTGVAAQSVEEGVLIIDAPNTSASMVLGVADNRWSYSTRGWTCLDVLGSVDQAIEASATEVFNDYVADLKSGLFDNESGFSIFLHIDTEIALDVEDLIGSQVSTDQDAAEPTFVNNAPSPGDSQSITINNCFRTPTQADVVKLKEALIERISNSVAQKDEQRE